MNPTRASRNGPLGPQFKPSAKVRKRAHKACLCCRSRKVRCDVSIRGRPCMNCYRDNETCIVTARASDSRRSQYENRGGDLTFVTPHPPGAPHARNTEIAGPTADSMPEGRFSSSTQEVSARMPDIHDFRDFGWIEELLRDRVSSEVDPCTENLTFQGCPSTGVENNRAKDMSPGTVLYCHYPFLAIANIHSIPPQDVNFLELQGCLRVPIRPLLDIFVQQYFLHVHPILPLINEGEFWRLYFPGTDTPPSRPISLMVFQAILFASCNFLSQSTVHALGYSSTRAMRASYYRRTKLLYDLGSESSPVCISQAALLLTFTSLSASRTPNTSWLSIAIENAKIAEAHLYASIPASLAQHQEQNILKRVWWCCIIRDRSTGLLMRRPIQITKDQFGGDIYPLGIADLADEFECSRVYNAATKRILAEILAQWIELNIILTDILMLVFPLTDLRCLSTGKRHDDFNLLSKCKTALKQWHTSVLSRYPVPEGETISTVCPENETDICYSSVILYTDLMLMYYHTSRVVLSHYEMLQLDSLQADTLTSTVLTKDISIIVNSRRDLQDAAMCITDYHKELVNLGLDRWLPISAIGCTALPLLLHILDIKLAPPVEYVTTSSHVLSDPKKHQLNALIEIMKTYQSQYDGVDWITDIVRHIVNFAQLDEPGFRSQTSGVDWTDILACQPGTYLRLTLALDLSLRKGRLAQDWDFPVSLRGLFAANASPLKDLVKANNTGHNNRPGHSGTISHGAPVSIEPLQNDRDSENEELPAFPGDEYIIEVLEGQIYSHLSGGLGG